MNSLQIQFAVAGLFFGIWPLFMNKSGLSGNLSSFIVVIMIALFIFPFTFNEFGNIKNANWIMVLCAGIPATLGMMFFGKGLFKSTPQEVSSLFITMIVVQIIVPAIYKMLINGTITMKQFLGFGTAILTAFLLN